MNIEKIKYGSYEYSKLKSEDRLTVIKLELDRLFKSKDKKMILVPYDGVKKPIPYNKSGYFKNLCDEEKSLKKRCKVDVEIVDKPEKKNGNILIMLKNLFGQNDKKVKDVKIENSKKKEKNISTVENIAGAIRETDKELIISMPKKEESFDNSENKLNVVFVNANDESERNVSLEAGKREESENEFTAPLSVTKEDINKKPENFTVSFISGVAEKEEDFDDYGSRKENQEKPGKFLKRNVKKRIRREKKKETKKGGKFLKPSSNKLKSDGNGKFLKQRDKKEKKNKGFSLKTSLIALGMAAITLFGLFTFGDSNKKGKKGGNNVPSTSAVYDTDNVYGSSASITDEDIVYDNVVETSAVEETEEHVEEVNIKEDEEANLFYDEEVAAETVENNYISFDDKVTINDNSYIYTNSYDAAFENNALKPSCDGSYERNIIGITYSLDGKLFTIYSNDPEAYLKAEDLIERGAKEEAVLVNNGSGYEGYYNIDSVKVKTRHR